eukprot:TRINITY_DN16545_c0_g1_i1.p1 TRINITY_DN16545_c0_g1~~TRINITY_DN16545_c0_g1_i1.p1  ORF type:complete len:407 (+),score=100.12 TRINITY_DN16545_c0_g1_i1:90-1310(+)
MIRADHSRSPRGGGYGAADSTEEIQNLVFAREQARHQKDWAEADRVRDRLRAVGVTCWDKKGQWECTDGRIGRIPSFADVEAGVMPQVEEPPSYPGGEAEAYIRHQVQAREQARSQKNFPESDRIRDELKAQGIVIQDKEKFWTQESTGLMGCVIGWQGSGGHQHGPTDTEIRILVVEREKARDSKDYRKSDIIRDDLRRHGVEIKDKEKIWKCTDGRSGSVPSFDDIKSGGGQAVVGGGVDLKSQILNAAAFGQNDPGAAQQTLQLLAQLVTLIPGGQLQQPARGMPMQQPMMAQRGAPMRPMSGAPSQPLTNFTNNPEAQQVIQFANNCQARQQSPTNAEIQWSVDTRERVRAQKDFQASDAIRDALKNVMNVQLFEKEKRWQAADGRSGAIPTWEQLGVVSGR